jgi:hypothetical protein
VETRRTGQFLRFALGARSPDRKGGYYKPKMYIPPEETKLKIDKEMYKNKTS